MSLKKLKEWLGMGELGEGKGDEPLPPIDIQLQKLDSVGIHVNPGIEPAELQLDWDQSEETEPYTALYVYLAGEINSGEHRRPLTDQLYKLTLTGPMRQGDFVTILESLGRVSEGEIPFENLVDSVDGASRKASIEFDLLGTHYCWDLTAGTDGLEVAFFERLVDLTEEIGVKGRYTSYRTDEGTRIIGYATPEELTRLRKETGLDVVWLA